MLQPVFFAITLPRLQHLYYSNYLGLVGVSMSTVNLEVIVKSYSLKKKDKQIVLSCSGFSGETYMLIQLAACNQLEITLTIPEQKTLFEDS